VFGLKHLIWFCCPWESWSALVVLQGTFNACFDIIWLVPPNDNVHFHFEDNKWMQTIAFQHPTCDLSIIDSSPSEPIHFGHIFWLYCQWMESLTKSNSTSGVERWVRSYIINWLWPLTLHWLHFSWTTPWQRFMVSES
jgi:hypothetical protein